MRNVANVSMAVLAIALAAVCEASDGSKTPEPSSGELASKSAEKASTVNEPAKPVEQEANLERAMAEATPKTMGDEEERWEVGLCNDSPGPGGDPVLGMNALYTTKGETYSGPMANEILFVFYPEAAAAREDLSDELSEAEPEFEHQGEPVYLLSMGTEGGSMAAQLVDGPLVTTIHAYSKRLVPEEQRPGCPSCAFPSPREMLEKIDLEKVRELASLVKDRAPITVEDDVC